MIRIDQLNAHDDNYVYMIQHQNQTIAIDPGEAEPVLTYLQQQQRQLTLILNTHMHLDHCGGNLDLKRDTGCHIIGSDERIPGIDLILKGELHIPGLGELINVLYTPGHTRNDCCYYLPQGSALFSGDTLFNGGCGHVFEGTMESLYNSLASLAALPDETRLYCGHEYSEENYRFAASIEPTSALIHDKLAKIQQQRRLGQPTVPTTGTGQRSGGIYRSAAA